MLVSIALVVPCFWLPIVSGVDLQSHLYNAWLATLIENGSIQGLSIAHQYTNVLVDVLLALLLKSFGASAAERILCCGIVLIFFWGAFRFISVVRGQTVYWLVPWLAVFSYGYVFQMGLLNYYLACGIVFWVFSFAWGKGFGWWMVAAIPLLIVACLAHPMPVVWLVGMVGYCWMARLSSGRVRLVLFVVCAGCLPGIRIYLTSHYMTRWGWNQLALATGIDQIFLHGWYYLAPAIVLFVFCVVILLQAKDRRSMLTAIPAQAYCLTALAIVVLPTAILSSTYAPAASLIADRLSLFSAVLLLALLSYTTPRRWYLYAGLAGAAIFFGILHEDVGIQASAEAKIASLVSTLPDGAHVVPLVGLQPREGSLSATKAGLFRRIGDKALSLCCSRLSANHLLERACIGHCFDFANYEPSTGQFRIRPEPGNSVVMSDFYDVGSIAFGVYEIKPSYPPLYGVIRCGTGPGDVFMRPLKVGETQATVVCPDAWVPKE